MDMSGMHQHKQQRMLPGMRGEQVLLMRPHLMRQESMDLSGKHQDEQVLWMRPHSNKRGRSTTGVLDGFGRLLQMHVDMLSMKNQDACSVFASQGRSRECWKAASFCPTSTAGGLQESEVHKVVTGP
eukprot:1157395-Pelagomonas_calceolata.AAC.9